MSQADIAEPDVIEKQKMRAPKRYIVLMHNDDTTAMQFVVGVLIVIFGYKQDAAEKVMMKIHEEGKAVVGNFTKDVAETKRDECMKLAHQQGFVDFTVTVEQD